MSTRDDGGPAYPRPYSTNGTAEDGPEWGMSLRDYFAGQALAGMVHHAFEHMVGDEDGVTDGALQAVREIPTVSYMIADAMLAEREREP